MNPMVVLTGGCASSDGAAPPISTPELHFDDAGLMSGSSCPTDRSVTYATFGRAFFAAYCTRCHGRDKVGMAARNGAPEGYNFDTLEGIQPMIPRIDNVAAAGPKKLNNYMPLTEPKPTDAERQRLGSWLACREGIAFDDAGAR